MGRPPAYLFVVRHGYRLDAADKQWHLSSPTPYDPPLTYSGWQQAKNLGARIASIIQDRVKEDELAARLANDASAKPKRKRYKVVLHSSPFLRCVQTSIAISAGLAQDSTPFEPERSPAGGTTPLPIRRSLLRLDAFLGEWLSPNYFELITPPPESVMMLASAKADLLRREDYTHYPSFSSHTHSNSQGQLWNPTLRTDLASPTNDSQPNGLGSMSDMASSLPSPASANSPSSQSRPRQSTGYMSPVPHYAVNNNNTIPPGYVTHARDACVDIDFQWDSTRSPLDWGDGGEFPEEWSDMHKRFRAGVQHLVDWYSEAENPTRMVTKTRRDSTNDALRDADDVETEAIVILVSHGAGCNALIGAITHQPALLDVGMTSLTMAVYNPNKGDSGDVKWRDPRPPGESRNTPPVHELYEMRLLANTDHIRSPAPTLASQRVPSPASVLHGARGRHLSFSSSPYEFSWNDKSGSRGSSANTALSGIPRSSTNGPSVPRISFAFDNPGIASGVLSSAPARPSTLGRTPSLWSPILRDEEEEEDDMMLLNFSHEKRAASPATPKARPSSAGSSSLDQSRELDPLASILERAIERSTEGMPGFSTETPPKLEPGQLGAGPGGLWGGMSPPDEADQIRDVSASKRRWTVTERS